MERQLDQRGLGDHLDRLFRAAWALCGSREDAEDLVQDTYARVLARPRMLRNEDDLGYLLRALRNTFLSDRRTRSRRPATTPLPEHTEPAAVRTDADPEAVLAAREVYAAVAALPPDYRDVVVAVDVVGLSYDEAAKALKLPQGTVMSRLYRGRNRVAEAVG
ncbi:MAG: RNA polymerase sigma factor [Thermoleophilia bacterium]